MEWSKQGSLPKSSEICADPGGYLDFNRVGRNRNDVSRLKPSS